MHTAAFIARSMAGMHRHGRRGEGQLQHRREVRDGRQTFTEKTARGCEVTAGQSFPSAEESAGWDETTRARTSQVGHPRPRLLPHSWRGPGCLDQNPAARSCSRSRSTAAGECSVRLPPLRAGTSWRWRARVRLATMAATATRLTPKVRISRLPRGWCGRRPGEERHRESKHLACRTPVRICNV